MTSKRLFVLDFIRSLSIIFIIFFHFNEWIGRRISADLVLFSSYTLLGTVGVSLFIILSGASLSLSNLSRFSTSRFYWKRFLAIFPLFYVSYLFALLMNNIFLERVVFPARSPVSFLLTLVGLDGFLLFKIKTYYLIGEWFLGFIIILYIAYPVIRFVFVKNMLMALCIAAVISFTAYHYYAIPMSIFRFPPIRLFEFVLGMYLMTVFSMPSRKNLIIFIILSSCFIAVCLYSEFGKLLYVRFILLGSATYIFLYCSASFFDAGWSRPSINFLSKYSYGAFLVHHQFINGISPHYKSFIVDKYSNMIFFLISLMATYFISFVLTNITMFILGRQIKDTLPKEEK